jgi:hypothetical protein
MPLGKLSVSSQCRLIFYTTGKWKKRKSKLVKCKNGTHRFGQLAGLLGGVENFVKED